MPPPLEEEKQILNTYSKILFDFVEKRSPVIISNGGYIRIYNNIDLYGIDMCIELTNELKKSFPNIGFIFALADKKKNDWYFRKMKKKIKELNIEKNFTFMTGHKEIWPLFQRADLMVRPTLLDGYSVSVAEALYFNCPVIASNVSKRPKGTIIFKNRNFKDFSEKCKRILLENN